MRIFLSWCHRDRALTEALLDELLPALALFADLEVDWWQDSHLLCGEDLTEAIVARLGEADYGLMLLSARYFSRPFIQTYELPRLTGPDADVGALPVALRPLPGYGAPYDLHGVERQLVFTEHGKSFAEMRGHGRTHFANHLAEAIRRRALVDDGYRAL